MPAIDQIGKTVPNVVLDTVILEHDNIVLKMHVKEYLYDNDTGTWSTDNDYLNKVQIRVKMKTERGESTFMIPLNAASGVNMEKTGQVQKVYITHKIGKLDSRIENLFEPPTDSAFDITPETDTDFDLSDPQEEPSFICETLDISAETVITKASLDAIIDFGTIGFNELAGKTSGVNVIANSSALTRTIGYFLNGSFYTGPKTQLTNGRWVTGNVQDETSEYLLERQVPNMRVMDNRDTVRIGNILGSGIAFRAADADQQTGPYLSPLVTTRDMNGVARFLFTLNYKKMYLDNSYYSRLFDNLSERLQDRVLLNSPLKNITVTRVRQGSAFASESPVMIASSGETSGDRFVDFSNDIASIEEEEFKFNKELFLRTFSGTDRAFKDVTSGKYKYQVSAHVKDGMYQFISFQLSDLRVTRIMLQKYVNEMAMNLEQGYPTQDFFDKVKKENEFLNRPYIRAMISLSENIYFYNTAFSKEKLIRSIRAWLSPTTGTYESANKALELMGSIILNLENRKTAISQNVSDLLTQGIDPANMSYTINETLMNEMDAAKSFKSGLGYLSSTEILESQDNDGLIKVSSDDFEKRIQSENISFFGSNQASFSIEGGQETVTQSAQTTSFTYLTPTSVRLDNQVYVVGSVLDLQGTEGVDVTSLALGDQQNRYKLVLSRLRTSRVTDAGLATETLDITPVSDPDFEVIAEFETTNNTSAADAVNSFGSSISSGGYQDPFEFLKLNRVYSQTNSVQLTGIDGVTRIIDRESLDLLPNHFKAVLAGSQYFGSSFTDILSSTDNGDTDPYNVIIGSLAKIEVLTGYKKDESETGHLVRIPIWKPLTYELYRANAGTNMLCRLMKYDNDGIGFKRSNDAAIYNHYFVLESPTVSMIYGNQGNGLQADINGARSLSDLVDIFANYGIEYDPNSGEDDDIDFGDGTCAMLADEKSAEEMAQTEALSDFQEASLQPLREGDTAPFAGILIDSNTAEGISDVLDELESGGNQ